MQKIPERIHRRRRSRGVPPRLQLAVIRGSALVLGLAVCLLGGTEASAQSTDQSKDELAVPTTPTAGAPRGKARETGAGPGLDQLLQLPSGYLAPSANPVAGASEAEWRRRFAKAQSVLDEAREALDATRRELDQTAEGGGSSQWAVAPPGGAGAGGGGAQNQGGPATSPLSFRLRQELARKRDDLDEAERAMRELRIEADLAGVPKTWRGPDADQPFRRDPSSIAADADRRSR